MTKIFPVQLPEALHRQLKHASIDDGMSLHDWILKTLQERIENGASKKKASRTNARPGRNSC